MPQKWSFFAHCRPKTLLSIFIEVTETALAEEYHNPMAQAWRTVTVGAILRRCYCRHLLIQPDPDDRDKCLKHVFYLLAAIELMNTFLKS